MYGVNRGYPDSPYIEQVVCHIMVWILYLNRDRSVEAARIPAVFCQTRTVMISWHNPCFLFRAVPSQSAEDRNPSTGCFA